MPVTASTLMRWPRDHSGHIRDEIDEILEKLDDDIRAFASRNVPRSIIPPEILDIEVDELAQNTRIKLWLALQRDQIVNPKAYARRITLTESADIVRRYRKFFRLPVDDLYDLRQGKLIAVSDHVTQDPVDEYEQKEVVTAYTEIIVKVVLSLPPRQQYAILCNLKDTLADIPQFVDVLLEYGLNLEVVHWPEDKDELQRLRASGSIGRRKLRACLKRENIEKESSSRLERTH